MLTDFDFKVVFDLSPLPIYILQDGFLQLVNRKMADLYGYSVEEMVRIRFSELIHQKDRQRVVNNVLRRLNGEELPGSFEIRAINRRGELIYIEGVHSLIEFGGRPAILGQLMDITERKRVEEALRKSEERYRTILDNIEDGYFEVDLVGNLTFFNDSLCRILGYPRNELMGMNNRQYSGEEGARKTFQAFNKVYRTGIPVKGFDWEIIRKDGSRRFIEASVSLLRDAEGRLAGFRGIVRDITERKRSEEALFWEKERLAVTISSIGDAVIAVDTAGLITLVNPVAESLTGWSQSEALGRPLGEVFKIINEYTRQPVENPAQRALPEGKIVGLANHTVLIARDGTERSITDSAAPIRDAAGNICGVILVFRNVTDDRKREEELRSSEARLRLITDNMLDMIVQIDEKGICKYVSPSVKGVLGYQPEDTVGRYVFDFVHPQDINKIRTALKKVIKDASVARLECRLRRADGSYLWLESVGNFFFDEKSGITGAVISSRDISSQRKEMEEQLKYLSLHESLTGLSKRAFFEQEMRRFEEEHSHPVNIIVCDVDGLKLINDTLGHHYGDRLLMAAVGVIRESARPGDIAARIGGDEFAVLLPNCDVPTVEAVSHRIRENVERYNSTNPSFTLSVSIGFAASNEFSTDLSGIFKEADNNMYREKLHRLQSARSAIVQTLMRALKARDFITEGHADRLQELVACFAGAIGLSEHNITDLRLLAQFHDIGKVGVSDRILFKPGPFTHEEMVEMQRHSEIGHRIAQSAPDLIPIADWILKHHEWWNGSGYPLGIRGEEIPLECRILAITDAYDAMTSDRPYRKAMPREKAVEELLRCAGTQSDPQLVPVFVKMLENRRL